MIELRRSEIPTPHPAIVLAGQDLTSGETTWTAEPHAGETTFSDAEPRWGTDYMHARYYKPLWGRFLSVDPVLSQRALRQPQAWNRYSYVQGNPMRAIDPNGEDWLDVVNGFGNGLGSSLAAGAGRSSGNSEYRLGQQLGDIAAVVVGGAEFNTGTTMAAGSLALAVPSGGAMAPAAAGGTVLATHGAVTIATAVKNIVQFFSGRSQGGAEGNSSDTKGLEAQLADHEKRLSDYRANPDAHDNRGFLKAAGGNKDLRQKIIDGRIRNLQNQIDDFRRQIAEKRAAQQ